MSLPSFSALAPCPNSSMAQKFIKELKPFEGRFNLGSCQIELHVCTPSPIKPMDLKSNPLETNHQVADLLIIKNKKHVHLPLFIMPYSTDKYYDWEFKLGRALYYRSSDQHWDPYTGSYEFLSTWIVKTGDRSQIEYIEVNTDQDYQGSLQRKFVCGTDRELEKTFNHNNLNNPIF